MGRPDAGTLNPDPAGIEAAAPGSARVGPVLTAGETASAMIETMTLLNRDLQVQDRGSYLRVLAPGRCTLNRAAVEHRLGRPFRLPADLEAVMPSFLGRFRVDEEEASWEAP